MDQPQWIPTKELDFLVEKNIGKCLIIKFMRGAYSEKFKERISKAIQYAAKKKRENSANWIVLSLDCALYDKWHIVSEALSNSVEELPHIDWLDFQSSDFSKITLFELYMLYEKLPSMRHFPTIAIEDSYATGDYKNIIKELKREKRGMEFLKKIYFRENKNFEEKKLSQEK